MGRSEWPRRSLHFHRSFKLGESVDRPQASRVRRRSNRVDSTLCGRSRRGTVGHCGWRGHVRRYRIRSHVNRWLKLVIRSTSRRRPVCVRNRSYQWPLDSCEWWPWWLPYSDNGLDWKAHPQFSGEQAPYLCDLELHDGLFIASGQDRIILQSSDGNNWQALSHPNTGTTNGLLEAIHYSNETWAAVGTAGTIIYSEDGVT